jgi:D-alanyl-lipoteichoic acid acyltransferase DltB (MBOAT superfamily)
LYVAEPETCRRSLRVFLGIFAHLSLLLLLIEVYKLEGRALRLVALTALVALPIHYLLPFRWKQPFFIGISMLALALVFGTPVAIATIGITLGLVMLASLPIPWAARVALVAGSAVGLGLGRAGLVSLPIPSLAWPILGSICMFRLVIYLHERRFAKQPETPGDVLSYFFLLPNFAFPLFPVVDYRTLRRGYFAENIHDTQRTGLRLLLRGIVHLLMWRLINHRLYIPSEEVYNFATLATFLVTNYLLYLRVSGLFHIACGLLHLFGYRLPETHHRYLLATGFTDYWRRINIYWKDFMVKLVFHPVAFRLKRWPQPLSLSIATVCVFLVTWFAHGFQSFWLRGQWGFNLPDALFWGVLGILVIINLLNDARPGRRRSRAEPKFRSWATVTRVLKITGTFTTIVVLWALWSSPSVESWLDLMRRGFE